MAAGVLAATAYFTGNSVLEWIGAAAVLCAFSHAQISDRMVEKQAIKVVPDVECYRKSIWFFVMKEALWFAYFILHHSYSALVGVILFLLYPIWRKIWRRYHPLLP
ncbi:MAG TPA: hypothetical protein VM577_00635 [Anaerovoracaceae bacterium]|nr:hypothetical protein [Anaerovoracaceae bacterium]